MGLKDILGDDFNVFGRGIRPITDKAEAMDSFRYHVAIENHIEPGQTVGELLDAIGTHYGIEEETHNRLGLTFESKARVHMIRHTLDYDNEDELLLDNRSIKPKTGAKRDIMASDLTLVVVKKPGDTYEADCSCDSTFMLETMEQVGKAIRAYFWFLPMFITIYLIIDNAGGHGTNDAKRQYANFLLANYNVQLIFQVPNSPETNLLDLGVWRALQSLVERLSFQERYDPDVLAATVYEAWE
jgi:hypothetical protein